MCSLLSIRRCASAASASGKTLAITGFTAPASSSGQTAAAAPRQSVPSSDAPRPERRAGNRQPAPEDAAEINRSDRVTVHQADLHEATIHREARQISAPRSRPHDVEHEIDTLSIGEIADGAREIRRAVIDSAGSAELLAHAALLVGAGRSEHPDPAAGRELDRRRADAAGTAVEERGLPRRETPAIEDVRPHREERLGKRRRGGQVHSAWNRQALHGWCDTARGVATTADQGTDEIAGVPAGDLVAQCDDLTRHFQAWQVTRPRRRRVQPLPLHDVRAVDARRGDANQDFSPARRRIRTFDRSQDIRCARRADLDRNHFRSPDGSRGDDSSCSNATQRAAVSSSSPLSSSTCRATMSFPRL